MTRLGQARYEDLRFCRHQPGWVYDVRIKDGDVGLYLGVCADDAALKLGSGADPRPCPQNRVFQRRAVFHHAAVADNHVAQ